MSGITTTPFRPDLAWAFRQLNLDWIERLFAVDPDPSEYARADVYMELSFGENGG